MKSDTVTLIQRILAGDEAAFASLVSKYEKRVHAYALREIGDFQIAEDITQETFLEVYQKLDTLKDPEKFSTWLHTIVKNLCIAWYRKERFQPESLEEIHISQIETDTYSRYVASEHAKATAYAQRHIVKKLLTKLKESDRQLITLHYFDGMTTDEIGTYLGIPENTIKSRLYRSRQRLKQFESMIQEELDITIEGDYRSQHHLKGEINMADEVRNQSDVDLKIEDMQRQISGLQEQIKGLVSKSDAAINSDKRAALDALLQLPNDPENPITWGYVGAYRAASGQRSSRGSIWTTSTDEFLSKAPDDAIANLASIFANTTIVAILRQLVEGESSVEDLAKGCDIPESEIGKAVEILIEANLASRTEDNIVAPKNDAVFYFLNFISMVIVHLRPEEFHSIVLLPDEHHSSPEEPRSFVLQ